MGTLGLELCLWEEEEEEEEEGGEEDFFGSDKFPQFGWRLLHLSKAISHFLKSQPEATAKAQGGILKKSG